MEQTFRRGDPVAVMHGRFAGQTGLVESVVHQKSIDQPNESSAACHVILDTGQVVTVEVNHLKRRPADSP